MADLAKIAISIVADPTSFESALITAGNQAKRFGDAASNAFQSVDRALQALANNPLGAVVMAIGLAVKAADALKGAIGSVRDEFQAMIAEGERAAAAQEKLQRRFGLSDQAAGGLMFMAQARGLDTGDLTSGLQAFSQRLGEAAENGGAAERALRRMGLSADELTHIPLDEAMGRIGDALNSVSNVGERNALRFEILGRRGAELEQIFSQGTAGTRRYREEAEALGLTFSRVDDTAIRNSLLARREAALALGSIRQSIANSLAAAFAPGLAIQAKMTTEFVRMAQGPLSTIRAIARDIGDFFSSTWAALQRTFEYFKPAIALIMDKFQEAAQQLREAWQNSEALRDALTRIAQLAGTALVASFLAVAATITGWIGLLSKTIEKVDELIRKARQLRGSGLFGLLGYVVNRGDETQAAAREREARPSQGITQSLQGGLANTLEILRSGWAGISEEQEHTNTVNLRMVELSRQLIQLQEAQSGAIIGQAEAAARKEISEKGFSARVAEGLIDLAKQVDLQERVNKLTEELRTPLERAQRSFADYQRMLEAGRITEEKYNQAVAKTFLDLERAQGGYEGRLVQAVTLGSVQAVNTFNQATLDNEQKDIQGRILAVLTAEQQRNEQARIWNREIRDALVGAGVNGVPRTISLVK